VANYKDKEIIKRQIAIFREVSEDTATRLEKAAGVKEYDGISGLVFNGRIAGWRRIGNSGLRMG
jgi:catalase